MMYTIDEQINELNRTVKCRLAPSQLHGIGVFALRDIKKGEELFVRKQINTYPYEIPQARFNELRPEVAALIMDRWANAGEPGRVFESPNADQNLMSFMNHAGDCNSTFGFATRDIKAEEEVTEDYNNLGEPLSVEQSNHYNFI